MILFLLFLNLYISKEKDCLIKYKETHTTELELEKPTSYWIKKINFDIEFFTIFEKEEYYQIEITFKKNIIPINDNTELEKKKQEHIFDLYGKKTFFPVCCMIFLNLGESNFRTSIIGETILKEGWDLCLYVTDLSLQVQKQIISQDLLMFENRNEMSNSIMPTKPLIEKKTFQIILKKSDLQNKKINHVQIIESVFDIEKKTQIQRIGVDYNANQNSFGSGKKFPNIEKPFDNIIGVMGGLSKIYTESCVSMIKI